MIKVGIVGATGYAGGELVRLLMQRDDVELCQLGSKSYIGKSYDEVFSHMKSINNMKCREDNMEEMAQETDVIFTATPQGFCASHISERILSKTKVIDLSADYRLKDKDIYEHWYQLIHQSPEYLEEAVYGLPEINRKQIKDARLVANPGCYPTCSVLTIYPLVKAGIVKSDSIIIDAKSGTSGAGRTAKTDILYCEVNENIKAYGVGSHRHTPEIEEQLSNGAGQEVKISFTPHLVPMNRGILITAYGSLSTNVTEEQIQHIYEEFYKNEPFIRLLGPDVPPQTRWVRSSNYVDISFCLDKRTNRIVMMGAMDNLIKGAAGQAVQNMNLLFGLPEKTGLCQIPAFL